MTKLLTGFFRSTPIPMIWQAEAAECGLACIAMLAANAGLATDLATLRRRFAISLKGSSLKNILEIAHSLKLSARPLKLPLEKLPELKMPCMLHWDMNHFVVLASCDSKHATIHDPAMGIRKLTMDEASKHFSGVAVEIAPGAGFEPKTDKLEFSILSLMGNTRGLASSLGQLLGFGAIIQAFSMAMPFFAQWAVDDAIVSRDADLLTILGIAFIGLAIMQSAISAFRGWVGTILSTSLNYQWLGNVFAHMIRLPLSYFEKRHLADISSRFSSVDAIQRTLTTQFVEAIIDGSLAIATAAMLFAYAPTVALISMAAVTLYAFLRIGLYGPLREATAEKLLFSAKQSTQLLETLRGIQAVRIYGRAPERSSSWLNALVDQLNAELRISRSTLIFQNSNALLFSIERILVIWVCASLVLKGQFSVGMLLAYLSYKDQFATRMASLIDKIFEFKMLRIHGERLADIVLTPQDFDAQPQGMEELASEASGGDDNELTIESLGFKYAHGEMETISNLKLAIPKGQCIAITGPSGGGKTTLAKLILGLLEPTSGTIKFRGKTLDGHSWPTFRSKVGVVMQDDSLFSASIADNVSFFDPTPDMQRIAECCKNASVLQDILAMPMGFSSLINESGAGISGGQKQRLLLARALYRNPEILILDEATSNLDLFNEHAVNDSISKLKLTRIVIAHRPETIARADRVVVLDRGSIVKDAMRPASNGPAEIK